MPCSCDRTTSAPPVQALARGLAEGGHEPALQTGGYAPLFPSCVPPCPSLSACAGGLGGVTPGQRHGATTPREGRAQGRAVATSPGPRGSPKWPRGGRRVAVAASPRPAEALAFASGQAGLTSRGPPDGHWASPPRIPWGSTTRRTTAGRLGAQPPGPRLNLACRDASCPEAGRVLMPVGGRANPRPGRHRQASRVGPTRAP